MIFMSDAALLQLFVQCGGSFFEAIVVVSAAIEIDRHAMQRGLIFRGQNEWAVVLPMLDVDRMAKDCTQQLAQRRARAGRRVEFLGRLGDQCRTLSADRSEHFRMRKSETQRAVASHGNTADAPGTSGPADAIFVLDERNEFLQEKVAVAHRAVGRINIKGASTFGSNDQKISDLMLVA